MMEILRTILAAWYQENHRKLPWRETTDPYLIWISEVVLQQTRVAQGLEYFLRFTARFPDVSTLASASEDEVLKLWQGLGYYSRARSLHQAAKDVMSRFSGRFPMSYPEVRSLRGVGEYTAAAICSFAGNQPYATVDGNVYRVLARLFDVDLTVDDAAGKRYFAELAHSLLDHKHPALHNQALMEFGALQCVPKGADCALCPLGTHCLSYRRGTVDQRPVKRSKMVVKPRYFNYLHIHSGRSVLLGQRAAKDIWQHLYEFPLIETPEAVDFTRLQQHETWKMWFAQATDLAVVGYVTMPAHVLSHRVIHACFYEIELPEIPSALAAFMQIDEADLQNYAVSRLMDRYLNQLSGSKIR